MTSKLFLLGEGDFSFTSSLSTHSQHTLFPDTLSLIIASSLDSREEVLAKYPHFADMSFPSCMSGIFHNVNAIDVASWPESVSDDFTVLWNHPHCGRESAAEHYQLLCHFFHALRPSQFRIIISLIEGQFERWTVNRAANKFGWYIQEAPIPFNPADFPNYQAKRNLSGTSFKTTKTSQETKKSWFYVFGKNKVVVETTADVDSLATKSFFPCLVCENKRFTSKQGLKTHVRQVHELNKYSDISTRLCEECGETFRGSEALYNHKVGVHAYQEKISGLSKPTIGQVHGYTCEVCDSNDFDHLMKLCSNEELEICVDCGKKFRNIRALIQHTSSVH